MSHSNIPFHATVNNTANPIVATTRQSVASVVMGSAFDASYSRLSKEIFIDCLSEDIMRSHRITKRSSISACALMQLSDLKF